MAETGRPLADRWLDELAALRAGADAGPAETWVMRTFARRQPLPAEITALLQALSRPRRIGGLTVALYRSDEVDAAAEVLVPVAPSDAPHLPWSGTVEVRGTTAPGHAVALTVGAHTVFCAGPVTVPQVVRRYRNRPRRWPRSGVWDAPVGSAL